MDITQCNREKTSRRSGFTLVELLVAVTIFIILTTLVVSNFDFNVGSERIRATARQLQAQLEGAKSRASSPVNQKPVGVRFLMDENFPGELNGMIYIESVESSTGGYYEVGEARLVDIDGTVATPNVLPVTPGLQFVDRGIIGQPTWSQMQESGKLAPGMKIRIPAQTGQWYTIDGRNFLTDTDKKIIRLTELPGSFSADSFEDPYYSKSGPYQTKPVDFEVDLTGVMVPIQGEEIQFFPRGTVIDLRASKVPSNWNINQWFAGTAYSVGDWVAGSPLVSGQRVLRVYRATSITGGGVSGTDEPDWSTASALNSTLVDNEVTWQCYDVPQFDVVFSPLGPLYGQAAAEGVIFLTLAETRDTRQVFENDPTTTPAGGTHYGLQAWDVRDHDGDGSFPDHVGSLRVISIFSSSGAVNVAPVDQTDVDNDGIADNLFNLALEGAVSK